MMKKKVKRVGREKPRQIILSFRYKYSPKKLPKDIANYTKNGNRKYH